MTRQRKADLRNLAFEYASLHLDMAINDLRNGDSGLCSDLSEEDDTEVDFICEILSKLSTEVYRRQRKTK